MAVNEAIVTLRLNNRILQSSFTNNSGEFSFQIAHRSPGDNFHLQIRHVAYQVREVQLNESDKKIEVLLVPGVNELPQVGIKNLWQVRNRNDTLIFNPEAYKAYNTHSVADLLSNIPGFRVSPDGQIVFQGRSVAALLIEGDNVTGQQYGILSKNLEARTLEQIELFDNYEDNAVLAAARNSRKLAVNLRIKEEFQNKVSGNISLGAGVPNRWTFHPSLALLRRKTKTFFIANTNNISETFRGDLFYAERFEEEGTGRSLQTLPVQLIMQPNVQPSFLPPSFTLNNQTVLTSLLGLIKPGDQQEITYRLGFEEDRQKYLQHASQHYFVEGKEWRYKQTSQIQERYTQGAFRINYKHNQSQKLAGQLSVVGLWHRPQFRLAESFSGDVEDHTLQLSKRNSMLGQIQYDAAFRIRNGPVFQWKSYASIQQNFLSDSLKSLRIQQAFLFPSSTAITLHQDYQITRQDFYTAISNFPKKGKISFEYGADYKLELQGNDYKLTENISANPHSLVSNFPEYDLLRQSYRLFSRLTWNSIPKQKIFLSANYGLEQIEWNNRELFLLYGINLRHEWNLKPRLDWISGIQLSRRLPDLGWFGPDSVIASLSGLTNGLHDLRSMNEQQIETSLRYSRVTGNSWSLNYNWTSNKNQPGWMPVYTPGLSFLQASMLNRIQQHRIHLDFRRYIFPLKGILQIHTGISFNQHALLVNQHPVQNRFNQKSAGLKWKSSFSGKWNFETSGEWRQTSWKQEGEFGESSSKLNWFSGQSKLVVQPDSRTHYGVSTELFFYDGSRNFIGQLFHERLLNQKNKLQLHWHNLFFQNHLRFFLHSANMQGSSSNQLVPSYFLIKWLRYL